MPNLAFINSSENSDTSFANPSIDIAAPVGALTSHLETIFIGSSVFSPATAPVHTTPSGWQLAGTNTYDGTSAGFLNTRGSLFYRIAPSTPGTVTIESDTASAHGVIRECHENPLIAGAFGQLVWGNTSGASSYSPASITTTKDNALVGVFIVQGGANGIAVSGGGFTERQDYDTLGFSFSDKIQATAGASTQGTFAVDPSSNIDAFWCTVEFWSAEDGGATTITSDAGSYGVTGQSVGLLTSRKIVSAVGSYAYSGVSAGLKKTSRLIAVAGAYISTGAVASLEVNRKVTADVGTYALTGSPVALSTLRTLTANAGSYSLSGAAVGLLYSQLVGMISGTYVLTGNAVALKRNSIFPLDSGVYALSGKDATLTKIAAGLFLSGSYTVTGIAAELRKTNRLIAQTGSYSLIGHAAALRMLDDFVRSIERTYVVNAEDRVYSVDVEDRSYIVASENRLNIVEG